MPLAGAPPAAVKYPAATRPPFQLRSATTCPLVPAPRACQAVPVQRATWLSDEANTPPAIRSPWCTVSAPTTPKDVPPGPVPIGCHADPFHRATLLAVTPPATPNEPPAIRSPLC